MSDEQRVILHMLQEGKLTAEEAERLLAALPPASATDFAPTGLSELSPAPVRVDRPPESPDMRRFRRYWEIPFFVGLVLLGLAGLCVSNTSHLFWLVCGWSVFAVALLIAIIGWLSQYSPWMHVRIKEEDGRRIAFSLPLPIRLVQPLLALARPFVQRYAVKDTRAKFEIAASLVSMASTMPTDEPISIEVDEDDGDHVQIFVG